MTDAFSRASTRNSKWIKAPPEVLYRAFTDPAALAVWQAPGDMAGQVHSFDYRVGGGYQMSLYYPSTETTSPGKTEDREDRYTARFVELTPPRKIVEAITFDTVNPAFKGEMIMEATFEAENGGTTVSLFFKGIPSGVRPEDNEAGTQSSLEKLARYVDTDLQSLEILRALGINGTPTITPIHGGFDMVMWKVEYEGQVYALRMFRPGAHKDCKHERIVMAAARAAGLPVPEVRGAGVWQNRPVLLITWLAGRTVADELRARPWHMWRLGIAFGHMQATIHAVPAPDLLRQQPDAWITWKCEGEQTLQDRLRHLPSDQTALLHLDYHLRNVLTDGKQITGIVDWTNAHAGDPRADAARTVSILRIFELAWRIGYQRERGRLKDMSLFYVWVGTVIQHDLAPRYKHIPQELAPACRWTSKWRARCD